MFLLFAGWCFLTYGGYIKPIFLPTPTAIVEAAIQQIRDGSLWADTKASVYRIMVGWAISTVFAIPIGVLMGNFDQYL